jgi:hypothetical protein
MSHPIDGGKNEGELNEDAFGVSVNFVFGNWVKHRISFRTGYGRL